MAGYTRQSSFVDGDTITAALFNDEYNQLVNVFSNTSGHKHDGTAAEGPVIGLIGDAGETSPNNKVLIDTTNNYIEFYVEVSSAPVQQLYIADGAIVPVTDNDIDLGTSSLEFKNLYLDGTAKIDTLTVDEAATVGTTLGVTGATTLSSTLGVTGATTLSSTLAVTGTSTLTGNVTTTNDLSVGGNLTVTGNATISGNLTFGDADTDSITLTADIASHVTPDIDNTYDLGTAIKEWRNLYIDGTANIDSLVADTADINAGTIDNTVIGGTTASSGAFTTITASSTLGVTGATTLSSTLGVTGAATLSSTLGVTGNTTVGGSLSVTGAATLSNDLTVSSGTITYGSLSDGTITITAFVDEDDMVSNSATLVPTQQSVKAYVDSQVTAQDLDFQGDTGGALSIDLDSETLTIAGGTGIDTVGSLNTLTVAIDSTVATLTGTQTLTNKTLTTPVISSISNTGTLTLPTSTDTLVGRATTDTLTNKTLTSPVINTGVSGTAVLDDDTFATASATTLATSESIKAYVDTQITAEDLDVSDGTTSIAIDLDSETLGILGGTGLTSSASGNNVTLSVDASQTQITAVGTLTTGTWNATSIADAYIDNNLTISGGTIDNSVIGGTTPAAADFTTMDTTGNASVGGNLTVTGDLTVNGTTTTVNSTTVTIDDPVFTLGGDTAPSVDDNKDRGIEFKWHNGTAAKVGFFGYDDSASVFTFIPDATNTSEVFSGSAGNVAFGNIAGTLTTAAQTNITSVGTLSSLTVSGDATFDTDTLYVDSTNNKVGIGTTSPFSPLHIAGGSSGTDEVLFRTTSGGGGGIQISCSDLSVANPVWSLGVFTSEELSFKTGSNERMRIDSSGNLGIGTTSPSQKLTVSTTSASQAILISTSSADSDSGIGFTNDAQSWSLANRGGLSDSLVIRDVTGGADRVTVDTSGNVGIGATTVDANLQVGALNTTGSNRGAVSIKTATSDATIGESAIYIEETTGAEGYYLGVDVNGGMFFSNSGASTPTFYLGDDDNVGIGTTSPNVPLQVEGEIKSVQTGGTSFATTGVVSDMSNGAYITVADSQNVVDNILAGIQFSAFNGDSIIAGTYDSTNNSSLIFGTETSGTTSEKMRINSAGNVGIGTASPSSTLQVSGSGDQAITLTAGTSGEAGLNLGDSDNETIGRIAYDNSANALYFKTNTSERMRIDSSGNVGIANASPAYTLDVTGTINASTDVKINGASAATTGKAIAMALVFG